MRKIKMITLIFVAIILATSSGLKAQTTRISNNTGGTIVVRSADRGAEMRLDNGETKSARLTAVNGILELDVFPFVGSVEKPAVRIQKKVENNFVRIVKADLTPKKKEEFTAQPQGASIDARSISGIKQNAMFISNQSDYTFLIIDSPFAGNALKPGQTSSHKVMVSPGKYSMTLIHDVSQDPKNKETGASSLGKEFTQAVWAGIIPEGSDSLIINNGNLTLIGGKTFQIRARSFLDFPFQFIAGPWTGALKYKTVSKRANVTEGFNSVTIQFKNTDGVRMQADFEILITPFDKEFRLYKAEMKNIRPAYSNFKP